MKVVRMAMHACQIGATDIGHIACDPVTGLVSGQGETL